MLYRYVFSQPEDAKISQGASSNGSSFHYYDNEEGLYINILDGKNGHLLDDCLRSISYKDISQALTHDPSLINNRLMQKIVLRTPMATEVETIIPIADDSVLFDAFRKSPWLINYSAFIKRCFQNSNFSPLKALCLKTMPSDKVRQFIKKNGHILERDSDLQLRALTMENGKQYVPVLAPSCNPYFIYAASIRNPTILDHPLISSNTLLRDALRKVSEKLDIGVMPKNTKPKK